MLTTWATTLYSSLLGPILDGAGSDTRLILDNGALWNARSVQIVDERDRLTRDQCYRDILQILIQTVIEQPPALNERFAARCASLDPFAAFFAFRDDAIADAPCGGWC